VCGAVRVIADREWIWRGMIGDWQDTEGVLGMFGEKLGTARRACRAFVEKGIAEGRRQDLTGGGLLRSAWGGKG